MSEGYQGVKFSFILIKRANLEDYRIQELIKWCKIFDKKNLAPPYEGGSYGNLSFRIEKQQTPFIITGTQVGLKSQLDFEKFVKVTKCDLENRTVFAEGTRKPSSESMLHYAIYQKRPDINAIFHGHSLEILENSHLLNIPETKKEEDYGTIELVEAALKILKNETKIFNLKNHGFFSLGKDMETAGNQIIEKLEMLK